MGTARNMFPSKDKRDLRQPILVEDLIQYDDLNGTGGGGTAGVSQIIAGTNVTISSTGPSGTGDVTINASGGSGTVTGVTATGPITSSGGTAPVISTSMATNRLIGRTAAGAGVMQEITVGSGLSLSGGTLSNSGLTSVPTIQQTITAGKAITNDILTIGTEAGERITTNVAIAIGERALYNVNGGKNIGIGQKAGADNSGGEARTNTENLSIGYFAGYNQANNLNNNIAIGTEALYETLSSGSIAIGLNAGRKDTGGSRRTGGNVFIGKNTGWDTATSTGNDAGGVVAIGEAALSKNIGSNTIAIGSGSGAENRGSESIIIGYNAGTLNAGTNSIAIGNGAGADNINNETIAIGTDAGISNTGTEVIAIGLGAGNTNGADNVIALGSNAGTNNTEPNSFIISNSSLPSFTDDATAQAYFAALTNLSTNCTYLYHVGGIRNSIGAYRT